MILYTALRKHGEQRERDKQKKATIKQGSHSKFRNHNYDFMMKKGQIL